jgi:hypothetical protein
MPRSAVLSAQQNRWLFLALLLLSVSLAVTAALAQSASDLDLTYVQGYPILKN